MKEVYSPTLLPECGSRKTKLVQLARAYQLLREGMDLLTREGRLDATWTEDDERKHQTLADPVSAHLYEIAWKIADMKATCLEDMHAKAAVVMDWCCDREDLKDALVRSLCADLNVLEGPERQKALDKVG